MLVSCARGMLKKVSFRSIFVLTPLRNSLICFFDVREEYIGAPASKEHDGVDRFLYHVYGQCNR